MIVIWHSTNRVLHLQNTSIMITFCLGTEICTINDEYNIQYETQYYNFLLVLKAFSYWK